MANQENLQPKLRQEAETILRQLSASERQALLIKCWMSHDARWFMAVAGEFGMEAANRLNQLAAREVGKVETWRIIRALQLPPVTTIDDYLLTQETLMSLLGPELLDYRLTRVSDRVSQVHVLRCFAYDNTLKAGIADHLECGIFARVSGWLDALSLKYNLSPPLGKCLMAQGRECVYTITLESSPSPAQQVYR